MGIKFESNLDKVIKVLSEKEEKALLLAGELLESQAKLLAPVGSVAGGSLRQNISHKVYADGKEKGVAVGTDIHYGIYVEKGTGVHAVDGNGRKDPWVYFDPLRGQYFRTSGMKPQPFLEPAVMGNKSALQDIIEEVLKEIDNN